MFGFISRGVKEAGSGVLCVGFREPHEPRGGSAAWLDLRIDSADAAREGCTNVSAALCFVAKMLFFSKISCTQDKDMRLCNWPQCEVYDWPQIMSC